MVEEETVSNGVTILVVEDDPALNYALVEVLEGAGYTVVTSHNGDVGLNQYDKTHPALVLSCIALPILDGIELLKTIRNRPGGKSTPFIYLTAHRKPEDIRTGLALGADAYLTKPVTSEELLAAVESLIGQVDE